MSLPIDDAEFEKAFNEKISEEMNQEQEEPVQDEVQTEEEPQVEEGETGEEPAIEPEGGEGEAPVNAQEEQTEKPSFNPEEIEPLLKPFKANGKEINPTIEERIRLMQLGSMAYKTQQELKPYKKTIKQLEKAGIDPNELAFAADILKGDKEAIAKLLKEREIDLMEIDELLDGESLDYSPKTDTTVTDQELAIEEAFNAIKESQAYNQTIQILQNIDDASKQMLTEDPNKIVAMNAHIESGLYDKIVTRIEKEKMLGRISAEVPFVSLYEQIGNQILIEEEESKKAESQKSKEPEVEPSAALAPKRTGSPRSQIKKMPEVMSDEEFLKFFNKQVLGR